MPRPLPKFRQTAVLAAAFVAPVATHAQTLQARSPLPVDAVVAALGTAGVQVSPTQIELPLTLTTESAAPVLHITGAEWLGNDHMRVRIACDTNRTCVPFFASVDLRDKQLALKNVSTLNSSFRPTQPIRETSGPALRVGQHTVLLLETDHMRISLPVISIDSGAVGSEVRVASLDRKKTYQAVVLSAQIVKGTLP